MKKIKVKICGIKNQFTALEAERNGADAIGLILQIRCQLILLKKQKKLLPQKKI